MTAFRFKGYFKDGSFHLRQKDSDDVSADSDFVPTSPAPPGPKKLIIEPSLTPTAAVARKVPTKSKSRSTTKAKGNSGTEPTSKPNALATSEEKSKPGRKPKAVPLKSKVSVPSSSSPANPPKDEAAPSEDEEVLHGLHPPLDGESQDRAQGQPLVEGEHRPKSCKPPS